MKLKAMRANIYGPLSLIEVTRDFLVLSIIGFVPHSALPQDSHYKLNERNGLPETSFLSSCS